MNIEIAKRLVSMRHEKGYSQEDLAEQLGLSRQAVSKWERAESAPDMGNLIALSKLYGVTIDDLLKVDDNTFNNALFEEKEKRDSNEKDAHKAAQAASEAAVRAAQAAVAATQARIHVEQHADGFDKHGLRRGGAWAMFPYPILCIIAFFFIGFFFDAWGYAWVVFLTIPLYYWIASIVERQAYCRSQDN